MIKAWLFPWEADIMMNYPLAMPVFMVIASILLSIFTWIRQEKLKNKNKQGKKDL